MERYSLFFKSINKIRNDEITDESIDDFYNSATKILENASKESKVKDSFKAYYYKPHITLVSLLKSEKLGSDYQLMYDSYNNQITFSTWIKNWENIKNLNDSFWSDFLEKSHKYNFKFGNYESTIYDNENAPEFKNKFKSINFNIMSSYISAMLHSKEVRQNIGFGQLAITWNSNHSPDKVIYEIGIAFKYFYKFNYNLWKARDIRRQNKINRNK